MDNIFSNFAQIEEVLTITVGGVPFTVLLQDYITYATFAQYWNAKCENQNLRMVIQATNPWDNVISFKMQLNGVDVPSTLSGSALSKLGL